jgi:cellulose synthase/poly-beta-1,6-N-acetylglucosamine synthase-like glycosyltransferase
MIRTTLGYVLIAIPLMLAFYAYIGYPLILWIVARSRPQTAAPSASALPSVSVVVPAYNEEKQIAGAIDALLAQDYPKELLQILILSDASTDRTDEIVRGYASRGVELLRMPERGGKTKAENASCALLRGSIVVNTDSSIRLHPAAVRELVTHMSAPGVGVASGRDVSVGANEHGSNLTEAGYVGYEMGVRSLETRTGGIVGASGSCYAIRIDLHKIPIRDDLSRDFSAALTAREHGFDAVSVDSAICFVARTSSLQREYRRKVRTITRGINTLYARRALLDPIAYGDFAWKLFSHKVCRWALPVAALPGLIGLILLAPSHFWSRAILVLAGLVAALAIAGALWPDGKPMPRLLSIAAFGAAANLAVVHAVWRIVEGQRDHLWEPTRR